jgi:hypothetical protein
MTLTTAGVLGKVTTVLRRCCAVKGKAQKKTEKETPPRDA